MSVCPVRIGNYMAYRANVGQGRPAQYFSVARYGKREAKRLAKEAEKTIIATYCPDGVKGRHKNRGSRVRKTRSGIKGVYVYRYQHPDYGYYRVAVAVIAYNEAGRQCRKRSRSIERYGVDQCIHWAIAETVALGRPWPDAAQVKKLNAYIAQLQRECRRLNRGG